MTIPKWPDGQPCKHPGCLSHITHPCEGCGRIGGTPTSEGTLQEYQLEEIWERHCELMEVIECDMRGDKSLMGKRDFYAAAKDVIKAYRKVKDYD